MAVSALDIKKLREETDAPLMECRAALEEAGNDFEKAKEILREKGKAAAAKRVGRATTAGIVAFATSADQKIVSGVVLECETDFVARNEEFAQLAQQVAEVFVQHEPGAHPLDVSFNGQSVASLIEAGVAKIRENIELKKAVRIAADHPLSVYLHHDKAKGAVVQMEGAASNLLEIGRQVAIQCIAFPPEVVSKSDIAQDVLDRELEIETQRAIHEGKNPEMAKNIAQGRINKEFLRRVVLLEQPFYKHHNQPNQTVGHFVEEEANTGGGTAKVIRFMRLAVGEN